MRSCFDVRLRPLLEMETSLQEGLPPIGKADDAQQGRQATSALTSHPPRRERWLFKSPRPDNEVVAGCGMTNVQKAIIRTCLDAI